MRIPSTPAALAAALILLTSGCSDESQLARPVSPDETRLSASDAADSEAPFDEWSEPVPVEAVNSAAGDVTPFISRDGLTLYFASTRVVSGVSNGSNDLWVSRRVTTDAEWGAPENLGPGINSVAIETAPSLSADGRLLFFSSGRPSSDDEVGCGRGPATPLWHCDNDILVSRLVCPAETDEAGGRSRCQWSAPSNLGLPVNTAQFEGGQGMWQEEFYFSRGATPNPFPSAPPPGPPGDIYVSLFDASKITAEGVQPGAFSDPRPVEALNTSFVEFGASPSADGREIYFTSRAGGSPDIWVSTRRTVRDPWGAPTRLGLERVNTAANDLHPSLSADGTTLYLASNRRGTNDIYVSTRTRRPTSP